MKSSIGETKFLSMLTFDAGFERWLRSFCSVRDETKQKSGGNSGEMEMNSRRDLGQTKSRNLEEIQEK